MKAEHPAIQIPQPGILAMTPHHPAHRPRHVDGPGPACGCPDLEAEAGAAEEAGFGRDELLVGVQQLQLPGFGAETVGGRGFDEVGEGGGGGRGGGRALEADVGGGFDEEEFEAGEVGVFLLLLLMLCRDVLAS